MKANSIAASARMGRNVVLGENVTIKDNCIIEDNVALGDNVYIDYNCIIRSGVSIGKDSAVGAGCILGEYQMDFFLDRRQHEHPLTIGDNALIRSGSILYGGSTIGSGFQTGHRVTIREESQIGDHVSVGTLSDLQGYCRLGNYVRLHSNVHIGQRSVLDDFVWIFPYVILTNDPTPPSMNMQGVHICSFAVVATGSTILPGVVIHRDALVGAGAVVSKDVAEYSVVVGNPARPITDVRKIRNKITGEAVYPWRYHFERGMPWQGLGFDSWYEGLDEETREMLFVP